MKYPMVCLTGLMLFFFFCVPAVLAAPPGNNLFEHATVLTGFPASATGTTYGATYEPGEPMPGNFHHINSSTWYTWTAPVSADVRIAVESDWRASLLAVWAGNSITNLVLLGVDAFRHSPPSFFMGAEEGSTYHIAVYHWAENGGPVLLSITNDIFSKISGTVFAPDHITPVSGSRVIAVPHDRPSFLAAAASSMALADANGNYLLRGLPAGGYRLRFDDPVNQAYAPFFYLNAADFQDGQAVHVEEGATIEGIDASFLQQAAFIRGQITGSDGQPPRHELQVGLRRLNSGLWRFHDVVESVAGSYTFGGLPGGTYRVEVFDASGFYELMYYDNVFDFDLATDIVLEDGATLEDIDFTLSGTPAIAGRVFAPDGVSPVGEIYVFAHSWPDGAEVSAGLSRGNGEYIVGGLEPGTYRLRYYDFAARGLYLQGAYDQADDLESGTDIVVPGNVVVEDIDIHLEYGHQITGQVTGADGITPLPWIGVAAYTLNDGVWEPVLGTSTDAGGNYLLGGLRSGTYRVVFGEDDELYLPVTYEDAPDIDSGTDIVLDAAGTVTGINASLTVASKLVASIIGPEGNPAPALYTVRAYRWTGSEWELVRTRGGGGAAFEFGRLVAGTYRLRILSGTDFYYSQYYDNQPSLEAATDIVVPPSTTVTANVQIVRKPIAQGTVTGPDGETPLPGIVVMAMKAMPLGLIDYLSAVTDADGTFIIRPLSPGVYTFRFTDPDGVYRLRYFRNAHSLSGANYITAQDNDWFTDIDVSMDLLDPPPPTEWIGMEHVGANQWELRFFGPVGSSFVIQDRVATTNEWADVGEPVTGQPGTNLFLVPSSSPWRQWRIRVAP